MEHHLQCATVSRKSALISASQPDSQASANTAKPRDTGWCTTRYACLHSKPRIIQFRSKTLTFVWFSAHAVRRPCSDFMDMLRRLISRRIIIIIIIKYHRWTSVGWSFYYSTYDSAKARLRYSSSINCVRQAYVRYVSTPVTGRSNDSMTSLLPWGLAVSCITRPDVISAQPLRMLGRRRAIAAGQWR